MPNLPPLTTKLGSWQLSVRWQSTPTFIQSFLFCSELRQSTLLQPSFLGQFSNHVFQLLWVIPVTIYRLGNPAQLRRHWELRCGNVGGICTIARLLPKAVGHDRHSTWWITSSRHDKGMFSTLLALCTKHLSLTNGFHKGLVMWKCDVFFRGSADKLLKK